MPNARSVFRRAFSFALAAALPAAAQHSATLQLPDSIMAAGTQVKWVKKLPFYCEGPSVDLNDGTVYFTEQHDNSEPNWPIWKINPAAPSDTGMRWITASNQSNGLFVDSQGRVIAAQKGKIVRYKKDGTVDATLAVSGQGATFNQANDFTLGKDGSFYFTDLGSNVFYVDAAGKLKIAATGLQNANGIEWIEEEKAVYLQAGQNRRFEVGADGMLTNMKTFFGGESGPDGCEVDSHGNFYLCDYSAGVVHVVNHAGTEIGKITFNMQGGQYDSRPGAQGNIDNCHFGGTERKTLYCTGDGGLYSLDLKIPGRPWAPAMPTALAPRLSPLRPATGAKAFRADGRWWRNGVPGAAPDRQGPRLPVLRADR
jgi:gluconolactonase